METFLQKIRRVEHHLCEQCEHEKCGTANCPIESLTDDDILNIYNDKFGND